MARVLALLEFKALMRHGLQPHGADVHHLVRKRVLVPAMRGMQPAMHLCMSPYSRLRLGSR